MFQFLFKSISLKQLFNNNNNNKFKINTANNLRFCVEVIWFLVGKCSLLVVGEAPYFINILEFILEYCM